MTTSCIITIKLLFFFFFADTRHRDVKCFSLGYTADKTSSWDLNTGNLASDCALQKIFNTYLLNAHEVTLC